MNEYSVEVQRVIAATVRVQAEDAEDAARKVNHVEFPLPPYESWELLPGFTYVVSNPASGEQLYEGDATEL
jgi:hypothetical protein